MEICTHIVVDIVLGCVALLQSIVIISVVDDEDSSRANERVKIFYCPALIPLITMEIWQVRKRVAHAYEGIKAIRIAGDNNVLVKGQPVGLLDHFNNEASFDNPVEIHIP